MSTTLFEENKLVIERKLSAVKAAKALLLRDCAADYLSKYDSGISTEETAGYYSSVFGSSDLMSEDFALFCREITSQSGEKILPLTFDESELTDGNSAKISYLKNVFSDRAYSLFSSVTEKPSAVYFTSFREVCEEVFFGRCKYAILPIYTSSDGPLASFRHLISKYDLKISHVTDVETDSDAYMRFALLQKGLSSEAGDPTENANLFVTVILPRNENIVPFLSALKALGADVRSINTLSAEYSDTELCFDIILGIKHGDLSALYLFLECLKIRYNVVGNYRTL